LKELKKYHLLQVKEKLKRQKSINEFNKLEADSEKCLNITKELDKLLSENHAVVEEIGVQSFVSNRRLMQKMYDQKQVISNRIEFLNEEKSAVLADVKKSSAKDDVVERKKSKVKKLVQKANNNKQDENIFVIKRG
jgi:hypothetical protein|tara:strand:- start:3009 stop:3416 length:408 start_codon:yes stop_codon:yes gene_type:complete